MLVARAQDVPGPELHRISLSRNVLAALLEAAIAAVYLEYGYDVVAPAIVEAFDERIEYASTGHVDSKTELQEALARTGRAVQYEVLEVDGPPHERRFVCAALIDGERLGTGRGTTKKAAEQEAAAEALAALGVHPPRGLIRGRCVRRPSPPLAFAARCTCAPSSCAASSRSLTRSR